MLVVDASAFVEFLARGVRHASIESRLAADSHWVVPEHFTIEVASALRGLWLREAIPVELLDAAFVALGSAHFDVWPSAALLPRVRELLPNASAYDAAYLALAEELSCPLLTLDERMTRVPGVRCAFQRVDP